MEGIASIGVALAAFAATNIDDLLLVSACFADPSVRRRDVVLGQFLGIGLLVAASAAAAVAALVVPEGWTALLGAVPLGLGIQRWWSTRGESSSPAREDALEPRVRSQWLSIAAATVANGGDNLGVYIPLFASSPRMIPVHAAIFAFMTAVWCGLGHWLVAHRWLGQQIRRHGQRLFPFVLIGLGLYILSGAQAIF